MNIEDRQRSFEIEFTTGLRDVLSESDSSQNKIKTFKSLFKSLQEKYPVTDAPSDDFTHLRSLVSTFAKQKRWNPTKYDEIQIVTCRILEPEGQKLKRGRESEGDIQGPPTTKKAKKETENINMEIIQAGIQEGAQQTSNFPSTEWVRSGLNMAYYYTPEKVKSTIHNLVNDPVSFVSHPIGLVKTKGKHLWNKKFTYIGKGLKTAGGVTSVLGILSIPLPQAAASWFAVSVALYGTGHKITQLTPPSPKESPLASASEGERTKLIENLESELNNHVKGQEYAKREVLSTLKANLLGAGRKTSCLGCFFFSGPTGVGKTELARVCANVLFGGENAILFLQGGQLTREGDEKALTGSAPGYIGHSPKGGTLTRHLADHPFSIVVFDEIEKATPEVRKLFLGLLDGRGSLTDFEGNSISCKNTIFIFTSNYGAEFLSKPQVQQTAPAQVAEQIKRLMIMKGTAPEFIGRLQKVLPFFPLDENAVREIIEKELKELGERNRFASLKLSFDHAITDHLAMAYHSQFGIRALQGEIDKIAVFLSEAMDKRDIQPWNSISLSIENGQINFTVS